MTAVFVSVLNLAINAGWVALAIMGLRLLLKLPCFRRFPRWCVCLLWAVVGLRLVCPFTPETHFSLLPSGETVPLTVVTDPTPAIRSGVSSINAAVNPILAERFAATPQYSANPIQILLAVLSYAWLCGIAVMLLYLCISTLLLYHRVRFATRTPDDRRVFECEAVRSPFVLGIIRPRIYLPYNMEAETRADVLAHEYAHLARRDHIVKPAAFLLLTVYWFQPLLWAAYFLLCRDIEAACDERAAKRFSDAERRRYAASLVRCSVSAKTHAAISACPLTFGENDVKTRVKSVLSYRKPTVWIIAAAVVLCAVFAMCFGTDPVEKTASGNTDPVSSLSAHYKAAELVLANGMFSFVQTAEAAPGYSVDSDGVLWEIRTDSETGAETAVRLGTLTECAPTTAETHFPDSAVLISGTGEDVRTLLSGTEHVLETVYDDPALDLIQRYTLFAKEDGTVYLLYSHKSADREDFIVRWMYRLTEVAET